jgi:hypothetical protein
MVPFLFRLFDNTEFVLSFPTWRWQQQSARGNTAASVAATAKRTAKSSRLDRPVKIADHEHAGSNCWMSE